MNTLQGGVPDIPDGCQILGVERVGEGVLITSTTNHSVAYIHIERAAHVIAFAQNLIAAAIFGVSDVDRVLGPSVPEPQRPQGGAS